MLLLLAYRLLLLSTDAGFYFLSLHFKRCSARKLHIISSIKIFTGSFCVAYSCWNRTWSGDVWCWLREQQKQEEMKVAPLLLFKAMSLHLGSKKKQLNKTQPTQAKRTLSPALNRMRERTKSKWFCRPGIVTAGGFTTVIVFLLMQVKVESRLPCGCLSSTGLPVKFCCLVSGTMCASCLLLFQCLRYLFGLVRTMPAS